MVKTGRQDPVYAETLDGHRFEIYEQGETLRLYIDAYQEKQYPRLPGIFNRIREDIRLDWEVEPTEALWPGN